MTNFTFIISTYNRKNLLERAIKSIYNQNYQNFEIILINDGGEDVTDVVKKFDQKIILIKNPVNKGYTFSKNLGVKLAKNNWIIFLDDDDEIIENSLNKLKEEMAKFDDNTLWFVTPRLYVFDNKNFIYPKFSNLVLLQKNPYKALDIRKFKLGGSIFNKEIFKKGFLFDENIFYGEDYEFCLRLIVNNIKFIPLNVVFYKYYFRIYESNFVKVIKDREYILKKHKDLLDKENLSYFYFHLSKLYKKNNDPRNSLFYLIQGLRSNFSIKNLIMFIIFILILCLPPKFIIFLEKIYAKTGLRFT
ncbi:MAG: glycosyltransferase [Candidatus Omnitrophica bacterium]|nr:glycosyltransferase [Candidatus Omnitrophota bacterium]